MWWFSRDIYKVLLTTISLREDCDTLELVSQKLSILWGDLERRKLTAQLEAVYAANQYALNAPASSWDAAAHQARNSEEQPPPESSPSPLVPDDWLHSSTHPRLDLMSNLHHLQQKQRSGRGGEGGSGRESSGEPFSCAIVQYGLLKTETASTRVDVGLQRRYVRTFGLFATRIAV